jgi:osmotically-inducible protein OsmY
MKTDMELKNDILEELKWEPSIEPAQIGVVVQDGIITLTGYVNRFPEKWEAENATQRVAGVKAVANEIEVKLPGYNERTDTEIAHAAVTALEWNTYVPRDQVKVAVDNGWITLTGEVEWHYQKSIAESAMRHLKGVRGVVNEISLKPQVTPTQVKEKIEAALQRNARLDIKHITVETRDGTAILNGYVRSWAEREEVGWAAWAAPGVTQVENNITLLN